MVLCRETFAKKLTAASTRLYVLGFLLITCASGAAAQFTMRIDTVRARQGDTVNVPISVTNFRNIGAISLKITKPSAAAKFIGITGTHTGVKFIVNAAPDVITLAWFDATGHTPMNIGTGVLMKLRVVYGGGAAPFRFDKAKCEIANGTASVIPVMLIDGGIIPATARK